MDVFSGGEVCVDHSLDYDLSRWQHCVCVLHVQCRGTSQQVQFHSFVSDDPSLLITCIKHPSDLCYLGCSKDIVVVFCLIHFNISFTPCCHFAE